MESHVQNKRTTAIEDILDTEQIIKGSLSLLQHNGSAAFKLSVPSPLPPAFSANDLAGGQTQIANVCQIR
jgi:hypothetical protein